MHEAHFHLDIEDCKECFRRAAEAADPTQSDETIKDRQEDLPGPARSRMERWLQEEERELDILSKKIDEVEREREFLVGAYTETLEVLAWLTEQLHGSN